ncbi:MAG: uroporphyrinogen decarboxylase family protein [Victivallaceae bacterium]
MKMLKCGERIVRCFTGKEIDRVPFGMGIGWSIWPRTLENWKRETGNPDICPAQEFGYEKSFALPRLESGAFPHFEERIIEEDEEHVISVDYRGITLKNRKDNLSMPDFISYPVSKEEDWEKYKNERLKIGDKERIRENWDEFRSRIKATGEAVQVGNFPWGMFGTARDMLGFEGLMFALMDNPGMVKDIMNHFTGLWISIWEEVAREVQIDHIHIWEDMSGKQGPLISPAMVEKFMMPCYDRVADFAQAHNVRLMSVDTDGDCSELLPVFMRHGVNVVFPFEVQAGSDVLRYREEYPKLGIWGGLDKRALAGSSADIDREIEKAAVMVRQGRYVPMFDHSIPPDAKWENFKKAAVEIRKICNSVRR